MNYPILRSLVAAGTCTVGLLLLASPSAAQDPYATVVAAAPSSYWGYTFTPYAATLHGVADVIRAQGDFLVKKEEAALLRQKVRRERLVTRKQELEHWEWERDFRAGIINRQRERVRRAEVEYSRNFPSFAEIVNAGPLNKLLDELVKRPELPQAGSTPVESEWLAHVHVSTDGRGNIGLLKGDKLFWPPLLLRPDFASHREKIDELLAQAKGIVLDGQRDLHVLGDLRRALAACEAQVEQALRTDTSDSGWNMRHFMEATRFLEQVGDALFVLERPDPAYYLNPLQGKTVAELVGYMKKNGVRFAPATVGCERAYVALHRALADEVTRLNSPGRP